MHLLHLILASLLVAATGAANLAVFVGGKYVRFLDTIANFAPILLALGLLAWIIAWSARSRLVVVFALALSVVPPAYVVSTDALFSLPPGAPNDEPTLKVMSFNVWSQNARLGNVAAFVRKESPQILFLQESSSKYDLELLDQLEAFYPTHVVAVPSICATHLFSSFVLVEQIFVHGCDVVSARLAVPAEFGGGEMVATSAHVSRHNDEQAAVLRAHMDRIGEGSAIVGGDFNRTPWTWALRRFDQARGFERRTHSLATWPTSVRAADTSLTTPFPVLPLDHLFATRDWLTVDVRTGPEAGSDHLPVIVELTRASKH